MGTARKTRTKDRSKTEQKRSSRQTTLPQSENTQLGELMRQFAAQQQEMQSLRQQLAAGFAGAAAVPAPHPVVKADDSTLVLGSFVAIHRIRSKSVTPVPEEFASALLEYDNDRFELCYGVVEGVPGGKSVNIDKGGTIPKDVVEVLLKFGVKPSPHDEKGEAGDHHDRVLAMHEQSITKLIALPANADRKINKEELQHDFKSILESEILVW
ncbi:hypothetical protein CYMTET_29439 [Cymbomonas tetramitiformis]|uniref:Uncharacterized protein n=1 Tax=Cymbomonas tetramitiformis TaxID=36881 RepID=A0AAE0FMI7_9CHLO|nr:hypothetical protein CYMTET_29439 [Cymbomonas tetramitiformis]